MGEANDMQLEERADPYEPVILELPQGRSGALLVAEERPQPNLRISRLDFATSALESEVAIPEGRLLLDFDADASIGVVSSQLRPSSIEGASNYDTADLILEEAGTSSSRVLIEAEDRVRLVDPVLSPSKNLLFFVNATTDEDGDTVAVVESLDLIDGTRSPLLQDALEPDISSDGQWLAAISIDPEAGSSHLTIAFLGDDGAGSTPEPRALTAPDDFHGISFALFSPDNAWLYFTALRSAPAEAIQQHGEHSSEADWWRVPIEGGEPERVLPVGETVLGGAFAPSGGASAWDLYFTTSTGAYMVSWPTPDAIDDREIVQLLRGRALRAVAFTE